MTHYDPLTCREVIFVYLVSTPNPPHRSLHMAKCGKGSKGGKKKGGY